MRVIVDPEVIMALKERTNKELICSARDSFREKPIEHMASMLTDSSGAQILKELIDGFYTSLMEMMDD